jgi:hypothetical protein
MGRKILPSGVVEYVKSFEACSEGAVLTDDCFTPSETATDLGRALDGNFSLHVGAGQADLYGMLDAVFSLYIVDQLDRITTEESREIWGHRILECQDEDGFFSKKNHRGHCKEHATAYAVSALLMLEPDGRFLEELKPMQFLFPLLTSEKTFKQWFSRMGMNSVQDIKNKNIGWNYIWRGSHVGGGVAAVVGMTQHLFNGWWPNEAVHASSWLTGYFDALNARISSKTGVWQKSIYNLIIRKPTVIELGGAAHFWWIYQKADVAIPYPEKAIDSIISVQKATGLYKGHPFCIDFDGVNGLVTAFSCLSEQQREKYRKRVKDSINKSFNAVVDYLNEHSFDSIYSNSHGLPGALAVLAESGRAKKLGLCDEDFGCKEPFKLVWWL